VEDFASDVAEKVGYSPNKDISHIVARMGGSIKTTDWDSARNTGSITVRGPNDFTIYLSPLSGERRSRFTIAHELGHYVLHSKAGKRPISVKRDGTGRVEWEANWFAAGFLMPAKAFRIKCLLGWGDSELAEYFGVSTHAVEVRRRSL